MSDELAAAIEGAQAYEDLHVDALFGQEEASALIEPVAVIIAGIIAIPPDPDVRIGDEAIERDAFVRALEDISHNEDRSLASRTCDRGSPEYARVKFSERSDGSPPPAYSVRDE